MGYINIHGKYYKTYKDAQNFHAALATCQQEHGTFAEFQTAEEYKAMRILDGKNHGKHIFKILFNKSFIKLFSPAAKHAGLWIIIGPVVVAIISRKSLQAREAWEYR